MNRAERRFRALRAAHRRIMSLPAEMRDQCEGKLRKWNMTRQDAITKARKEDNAIRSAFKCFRRNG